MMRRLIMTGIAVFFVSTVLLAGDGEKGNNQFSVFTSDLGWASGNGYSARTGGFGLAYARTFTRHWSAEFKIADEQHYAGAVTYSGSPATPVTAAVKVHTYPIDLLGYYRFPNESRWTPYVDAGFRYVRAPDINGSHTVVYPPIEGFVPAAITYGNRYDLQVGAGTSLRITPHLGLRFDGNALLRQSGEFYDDQLRFSFGVGWHF